MRTELPHPADWQEFESLCWTLWKRIWNDPNAQRLGRSGQAQDGVDVYGRLDGAGPYQAVQCKRFSAALGSKVTTAILRKEVDKAKGFTPPLRTLIIATTAPNDATIQTEARRITAEQEGSGGFAVQVLGWEEIVARLREHPDLYAGYVSGVFGMGPLVAGLPMFPNACTAHVRNFLQSYLGTEDRPVPFGGRDDALKTLDDWLDDPTQPSYRLLTGPAGRGKSALLAHWVARLRGRDGLKIVYFPVSLRFQTNQESVVLQALAARLAHVLGDIAPANLQDSPAVWRELVADCLRRPLPDGQRLLVVLDGLDEADGWADDAGLFPPCPPPGLRVVVAVRAHPEAVEPQLHRLGWQRPGAATVQGLDRLSRDGVCAVLESLGRPLETLAADTDLIGALHRLSEGDPLLVKLYVEDLQRHGDAAARLRPEDLAGLPSGLHGYFLRWWEDQRALWRNRDPLAEGRTRAVLGVLACAIGPLPADDLIGLLPAGVDLSRQDLRACLEPLARFVIGDGREQGYVLAHPRFGDHLREETLTRSERAAAEARLLDWGWRVLASLNDGTLTPAQAPPYAVRHFGAHLHRAEASAEQRLSLVVEAWCKAWHALEGSYQGFLGDVDRAWDAAADENHSAVVAGQTPPHLGGEVLCALCRSSIGTLSANLHPKLLGQLLSGGIWSRPQMLAYLRLIPNEEQAYQAIAELGRDAPPELVQDLLAIGRGLRSPRQRARTLHALLERLDGGERRRLAAEILAARQAEGDAHDLWHTAGALAPYLDEALMTDLVSQARAIKDDVIRASALADLVPTRGDLFDEAWEAARRIDSTRSSTWHLVSLLPHAPHERAPTLAADLLNLHRFAPHREVERFDFERAATFILPLGDEALWTSLTALALEVASPEDRIDAVACLAKLRPDRLWEPLFDLLRAGEGGRMSCLALSDLAEQIPDGLLDMAEACARSLRDADDRVQALQALARRGRPALLGECLDIIATIQDQRIRSHHMEALAPDLPTGLLDRAHALAVGLEEPEHRAKALIPLARLNPDRVIPQVMAATDGIGTYKDWYTALLTLADALPSPYRETVALEAVDRLVKAPPFEERSFALSYLADIVPSPERRRVLEAALSAGMTIADEEQRTWTFVNAMRRLPDELLVEALAFARGLAVPYHRAAALVELCDRRPTELLGESWEAIQQVERVAARLDLIGPLQRHAAEPLRTEMAEAAFESMSANKHQINSIFSFCRFADHIPDSRLDEARRRATGLGGGYYAAMERAAFARRVPDPERTALVADVLRMREEFRDEAAGCWVLSELPRPLPPGIVDDAVRRAQQIPKPDDRLSALLSLRNDLPPELRQEILAEAVEEGTPPVSAALAK